MSTSVIIEPIEQAMVRVAHARLKIALSLLADPNFTNGVPTSNHCRALQQINAAIEELEINLPFITKGTP